jgi:hypothetical protein
MWSGKTGKMMPAAPMVLEDWTFLNSAAVADLNGDGYPEVLIGSGGYYLHALDACAREPVGWPKFTGQWIIPTPAVGDIVGDGKLDVAVGTRDGWLYAWRTSAVAKDSVVEWESYHHDNRNTGNYNEPLTQGGKSKATQPLDPSMCMAPTPPPSDEYNVAGGGCACELGANGSLDERLGLALGASVAGLVMIRRRRKSWLVSNGSPTHTRPSGFRRERPRIGEKHRT